MTVYLLTPINEASDETPPHPNTEEDFDYWVGCEAQWKNGEATVPSYSVSSPKLGVCDVGLDDSYLSVARRQRAFS
jgi:hypothetical protein